MASYFGTTEVVVGSTIIVILMLLAFFGNLLTSLVFYRRISRRTPTNISISFLSVSDILMAILVMPFSLVSLIEGEWPSSQRMCTFVAYIMRISLGVSVITMAISAVIRYLHVLKPACHPYLKPRHTFIAITAIWLSYILLNACSVFMASFHGFFDLKRIQCRLIHVKKIGTLVNNTIGLVCGCALALVIFVSYSKVFRFVSHHNQTVASNLQQGNASHIEEAKVTRTLVIVVVGFAACWFPAGIIQIIDLSDRSPIRLPASALLLQMLLVYTSSAINPLIYGFTNRKMRKEYSKILRCSSSSGGQIAPA